MTLRVVLPDVLKLRRLAERRDVPEQMAQPPVDGRVSRANVADVGLEMLHVDRVEAHDRGEEADVRFGDGGAEVERGLGR